MHSIKSFLHTITGKFVIVVVLLMLSAALALVLASAGLQRSWNSQQIAQAEDDVSLLSTTADNMLTLFEDTLLNLSYNNSVFDDFRLQTDSDSLDYWQNIVKMRKQLSTLTNVYSFLENSFVYYPEEKFFLNDQVNPEMTECIIAILSTGDSGRFSSWHTIETSSGYYLAVLYQAEHYCIGAWTSYMALLTHISQNAESRIPSEAKSTSYFFADSTGKVLTDYSSFASVPIESQGTAFHLSHSILISRQIPLSGTYIYRQLQEKELKLPGRWQNSFFYALVVFSPIFIAVVIFCLYRWVLLPIHHLSRGIRRISDGDINYRLTPQKHASTEFQHIEKEFNQMLDQVETMRIRLYEQELSQKETKLRYLSQQIQPHFILNSLNTLYTYSSRDVSETKKIIRLLSQYYRYVVNIESEYVQVGQELDHLENYLAIQKIRFPNKLHYEIQRESSVSGVPVPPFLLESFISNALKYGQDDDGHIRLLVQVHARNKTGLHIMICDHGNGFPEEVQEAIRKFRSCGEKNTLTGIGIFNCMERLSLLYADKAAIICANAPQGGAVVNITIENSNLAAAEQSGKYTP